MARYPFSFEAVCYDSDEHENYLTTGMGFATSFANAAGQVETYCGNDLIKIKSLELYEESSLLLLPKEVITKYARDEHPFHDLCDADGNPKGEDDEF